MVEICSRKRGGSAMASSALISSTSPTVQRLHCNSPMSGFDPLAGALPKDQDLLLLLSSAFSMLPLNSTSVPTLVAAPLHSVAGSLHILVSLFDPRCEVGRTPGRSLKK